MTAALAAAVTMVALCGCETTAERSAELQRAAKHELLASQGVSVTRESPSVKVLYSVVVHSKEGAAVVVGMRNTSSRTLENAPIEITVRDAHGRVLFKNDAPGLEPSLTRMSLLMPGSETVWVDDQVQAAGTATSASALVGEAVQASREAPQISLAGARLSAEAGSGTIMSGTVRNRSQVTQQNLVVYAVGRRGSKVAAAGRAVLPEVAPGANVPFQIYFVGDPSGVQISTSAPPTSF